MSVSELLTTDITKKKWSNLYVNTITAASNIESTQGTIIAKNTAAQNVPTGTSTTALFNTINTTGTSITYNAGTFTANKAGKYLVSFSIDYPAYTAGGPVNALIVVTSSGPSQGNRGIVQLGSSQAYGFFLSSSDVLSLNQSDTFIIRISQNSGGNLNLNSAGTLSVYQLP